MEYSINRKAPLRETGPAIPCPPPSLCSYFAAPSSHPFFLNNQVFVSAALLFPLGWVYNHKGSGCEVCLSLQSQKLSGLFTLHICTIISSFGGYQQASRDLHKLNSLWIASQGLNSSILDSSLRSLIQFTHTSGEYSKILLWTKRAWFSEAGNVWIMLRKRSVIHDGI